MQELAEALADSEEGKIHLFGNHVYPEFVNFFRFASVHTVWRSSLAKAFR
jgi:hypothetical protein